MKKSIFLLLIIILFWMPLKADSLERLSAIATGQIPHDTKPQGMFTYVADREGLVIVDISDTLLPILTFRTIGILRRASGVDILDSLCYANHQGSRFWIGHILPPDTIIYIVGYDLPNSSAIPSPWGIEVVDTILFVADGNDGLFIFNVKDPTNPTQIASYDTPDNLTEFFILDSLIYLADCDSVIILNIANPASAQYVGAVDIPRTCTDVYVIYPYAYATCHASPFGSGDDGSVKIIDVSNPSNPSIVGSMDGIRGNPRAVFVNDDYIYVAARDWWFPLKGKKRADVEGGVRVARGQVPDSLIISYDTPGEATEVFVRGNLLLVPDADSLQILYHNKVGIGQQKKKNISLITRFSVYPNPAKDRIVCKLQIERSSPIVLSVYDETGRKIREIYRGPIMPGNIRFYWDGRDQNSNTVSAGKYFITVSTLDAKYTETKKVVHLGIEK